MPRHLFTLCFLPWSHLRPRFPCSLPPPPPVKPNHLRCVLTDLPSRLASVLQVDWLSAGKTGVSMNRCCFLASSPCAVQRKPVALTKCVKHSHFHSLFSFCPRGWPSLQTAAWCCKPLGKSVECFQSSLLQILGAAEGQGLLAWFMR